MPVPLGVDLARTGLGAPPKAPVLPGTAGPSEPGRASGEGLLVLLFFFFFVVCFVVLICISLVCSAGRSADTLSGWAEYLNALYKEIGGYLRLFVMCLFLLFAFTLLMLSFLCRPGTSPLPKGELLLVVAV